MRTGKNIQKMKKYVIFACTVLVVLGLLFCHSRIVHENGEAPTPTAHSIDTVPMLVTQVQKCAKLYTAEYRVHKIVTHDDVLRLKGTVFQKDFNFKVPLGDRKIAIPMDATLKAYIDFSEFDERSIERDGDKITILLPDPQVVLTSSKINQKEIKEYVGIVRAHFSDSEMSNYEQQGRLAIINSIPDMHIIETAQANAARVLVPMIVQMGYSEEDITITFRKNLTITDIIKRSMKN